MATQSQKRQSTAKTHQGLSYRSLQAKNSANRQKLAKTQQNWLRDNGYKNVGWDAVIRLAAKIADLLEQDELADMSLESLFLEADRVGNKYQTAAEVEQFQQAMAQTANAIADQIDAQFPQTELEVIDFSRSGSPRKPRKSSTSPSKKRYTTISQ
jgi:hypothetical protein